MKRLRNENGAVTVLIALGIVAMLGMTALVVDYGRIAREDQKLTKAIDAAVLAGVQELPDAPNDAVDIAEDYLQLNGFDTTGVTFTISGDHREITGEGTKTVSNFFARVLGHNTSQVYHRAKAGIYSSYSISSGLKPLFVQDEVFYKDSGLDPDFGTVFTLKFGPPSGLSGNFGYLEFDRGDGLNEGKLLAKNFVEGSNETWSIGDVVPTETGNMGLNFSYDSFSDENAQKIIAELQDDPKWIIPIINVIDGEFNGGEDVVIISFAAFNIITLDGKPIDEIDVTKVNKNTFKNFTLEGAFVESATAPGSGNSTTTDTGVQSIALTE